MRVGAPLSGLAKLFYEQLLQPALHRGLELTARSDNLDLFERHVVDMDLPVLWTEDAHATGTKCGMCNKCNLRTKFVAKLAGDNDAVELIVGRNCARECAYYQCPPYMPYAAYPTYPSAAPSPPVDVGYEDQFLAEVEAMRASVESLERLADSHNRVSRIAALYQRKRVMHKAMRRFEANRNVRLQAGARLNALQAAIAWRRGALSVFFATWYARKNSSLRAQRLAQATLTAARARRVRTIWRAWRSMQPDWRAAIRLAKMVNAYRALRVMDIADQGDTTAELQTKHDQLQSDHALLQDTLAQSDAVVQDLHAKRDILEKKLHVINNVIVALKDKFALHCVDCGRVLYKMRAPKEPEEVDGVLDRCYDVWDDNAHRDALGKITLSTWVHKVHQNE
ncbi:hypothetical protein CYMTET_8646 [Cymbomonas tetramitiformis]|uniref:Uncharacterized protein n=1 Tax=Cymbomonas tetramitiformis TaxID=36881 RepID=A0AAE0LFM4_9CHLO|nr:hypothetical protein CYMTET_8646 [Cymbomonas tetramitiformis]